MSELDAWEVRTSAHLVWVTACQCLPYRRRNATKQEETPWVHWPPDKKAEDALNLVAKAAAAWGIPNAKVVADVALQLSTRPPKGPDLLPAVAVGVIEKVAEAVRIEAENRCGPATLPQAPPPANPPTGNLSVKDVTQAYSVVEGTVTRWCKSTGQQFGCRIDGRRWHIPKGAEPHFRWPKRRPDEKQRAKLPRSVTWECLNCSHEQQAASKPVTCKCGRPGYTRKVSRPPT